MPGRIGVVEACGKTEQPKKFGLGMFDAGSWMGTLDGSKNATLDRIVVYWYLNLVHPIRRYPLGMVGYHSRVDRAIYSAILALPFQ